MTTPLIITETPSFGHGNAKLPDSTLTFALPSGFTCPGALHCLAKADRRTGRIKDGPATRFRCYEASAEARFSSVRERRWRNFDLIKHLGSAPMADLLLSGIEAARNRKSTHVRWFTGGDFFSEAMRDAVIACANATPDLIHYAYTKVVPLLLENGLSQRRLPHNLRITVSWGGRFDELIHPAGFLRTARVLNTEAEAEAAGLPIDCTDRLAWQDEPTHFCHLVHGGQPAGSAASQALAERRRRGAFAGYGRPRRQLVPA